VQIDRQDSESLVDHAFFVWLPSDANALAEAAAASARWVAAGELNAERVPAVRAEGLPYGISDVLWRVRASDPLLTVPFVEQLERAAADEVLPAEQQHLAERVLFVRPVASWGPEAAHRFGSETAERALQRLMQALDDAGTAVSEGRGWDVAVDDVERQTRCLSLVRKLSTVWEHALSAHASGDLVTAARSFAWAAAQTREFSANNYSERLLEHSAVQAGSSSYLESRRWQARMLAEILGLEAASSL